MISLKELKSYSVLLKFISGCAGFFTAVVCFIGIMFGITGHLYNINIGDITCIFVLILIVVPLTVCRFELCRDFSNNDIVGCIILTTIAQVMFVVLCLCLTIKI